MSIETESLKTILTKCIQARAAWLDEPHTSAFRLFNGFIEGEPDLVADIYGRTLVLYNYADDPATAQAKVITAQEVILEQLNWIAAVMVKTRRAYRGDERSGKLTFGEKPDRKARENGVWYALDLDLNLDSSLYLDTRNLRTWAKDHLSGKRVLNTFAYTGSLGVAAQAGGASQVIQIDLNRRFLNLAKDSFTLNGFPVHKEDFVSADFWLYINTLKRQSQLFDCVFVDPPFFSVTDQGRVDLVSNSQQMINKVRPLVAHDGWLVTINNALFVSGQEYYQMLQTLCADGYMQIEDLIPAPDDFTGFPSTRKGYSPVNPAPFNHSTKIAILRVKRKDEKTA